MFPLSWLRALIPKRWKARRWSRSLSSRGKDLSSHHSHWYLTPTCELMWRVKHEARLNCLPQVQRKA